MPRKPPTLDFPAQAAWDAHLARNPGCSYHAFLVIWRCEQDLLKREKRLKRAVLQEPTAEEPMMRRPHKPFWLMSPKEKMIHVIIQRRLNGGKRKKPRNRANVGKGNPVSDRFTATWKRKQASNGEGSDE